MLVDTIPNRKSPSAVLLRESYREGGRVKKRTLANLSKLPPALIESIVALLDGGKVSGKRSAEPGCQIAFNSDPLSRPIVTPLGVVVLAGGMERRPAARSPT
jgi:hypothetical protein